ncbi:hypothetical protein COLO4_21267 [Corchorus olitorius]|uniref:Uncharacterized protein n=1 Tax=Corchorus olitorius TaxID=93759 RepID=A0A1R3IUJ0_9ROSI|nr:hypothetical protein COLO4_21267 [Corchorus olitorius]
MAIESRERSREEEDNLDRSTKMVKATGSDNDQPPPRLSFKDATVGSQINFDELSHKATCPYFPSEDEGDKQAPIEQQTTMANEGERVQQEQTNVYAGDFGPWMIADSRKSRRPAKTYPQNRGDAHQNDRHNNGSRFAALSRLI